MAYLHKLQFESVKRLRNLNHVFFQESVGTYEPIPIVKFALEPKEDTVEPVYSEVVGALSQL